MTERPAPTAPEADRPTNPYRARLEQDWRASGTDLPFLAWNQQRVTQERIAELAEEEAAALQRRLAALIPDRYVAASSPDTAVSAWVDAFVPAHEERTGQGADDDPPWTPA